MHIELASILQSVKFAENEAGIISKFKHTPCIVGCTASAAGRIGAVAGISGRVVFADFSSRSLEKYFAKIATSRFLSPYLPNLILIERLWKFTKKKCLYNRYHETFCHFKAAIDDCIDKVKSVFKEQVKTLLNPKFQLFEKSAGVTT